MLDVKRTSDGRWLDEDILYKTRVRSIQRIKSVLGGRGGRGGGEEGREGRGGGEGGQEGRGGEVGGMKRKMKMQG